MAECGIPVCRGQSGEYGSPDTSARTISQCQTDGKVGKGCNAEETYGQPVNSTFMSETNVNPLISSGVTKSSYAMTATGALLHVQASR